MSKDVRLCFFGDSLVNGTGDRQALGWTGRICRAVNRPGFIATYYNLGVRRNTSQDILSRWRTEFDARNTNSADCRIVFSFGVNDTVIENKNTRVSEISSLENAHSILNEAVKIAPVIWIGPTPVDDIEHNLRIENLSKKFEKIAKELGIKYLPVFDSLRIHSVWMKEVQSHDGSHPDGDGYALLSALILNWPHWWKLNSILR